ncbi:MAG: alpha-L-fucosidase, partial [Calditrichaceae bacterium]
MKKLTFIGIILALLIHIIGCTHKPKDKMEWWRNARFGMFIHWGIYSVPAGVYKGKDIPMKVSFFISYTFNKDYILKLS